MACHFCLRHSTCPYYFSLSFIALLVDTNIYRSLWELDCLENRFSSLNLGEVLYASFWVLMIVCEMRLERLLFVWGEKRDWERRENNQKQRMDEIL
jgi:hypothetical protein